MSQKTRKDVQARTVELINKKVSEIKERRRGLKVTSIEDELDNQELKSYMKRLGIEKEAYSFETTEEPVQKNWVYKATLGVEILLELSIIYYTASILLKPNIGMSEYAMALMLMGAFTYLAFRIVKTLRAK
jgi:hypothetical protein